MSSPIKRPKEVERLADGQPLVELSFLQMDAQSLPQLIIVASGAPATTERLGSTIVWRQQTFKNLNRRGLAGSVWPE